MKRLRYTSTFILFLLLAMQAQYTNAQRSLFAEPRAQQIGDLIVIVLAERTAAQSESAWGSRASSQAGGSAGLSGAGLAGRFNTDAQFQFDNQARSQSVQRDLLNGTVTATVTGIDESGNLLITGERILAVNGERYALKVSGLVRPIDVRFDNSLLSYHIANADIEYRQSGGRISRMFKPGFFARVGLAALVGGAVYAATR